MFKWLKSAVVAGCLALAAVATPAWAIFDSGGFAQASFDDTNFAFVACPECEPAVDTGDPAVAWIPIELARHLDRLKVLDEDALDAAALTEAQTNRVWARFNAAGKVRVRVRLVPIPLP